MRNKINIVHNENICTEAPWNEGGDVQYTKSEWK